MNFDCGSGRMNWKHLRTWLASLLVAGLASGCIESQWEKEVVSNPSVAKVSAADLCKAFHLDKTKANQEYKGSIIEVYGAVQETQDEGERVLVILRGGTDGEVYCRVSAQQEADLSDLKVGRPVMIKGKCRGIVRGNLTLGGCVIEDPLRALKAKARSGDVSAEFALANALSKTNDTVHDVRRSFQLYCKAAEKGHDESKAMVTKALMGAWGPETNSAVAWDWLREEAEGGNMEACYQLGMLYNMDEDFGIDPKASVPWFSKSSEGGHPEAMFTMAMLHYEGELVPTNRIESARLLSLIDPKVVPRAPEFLGLMALAGDGVPKDVQKGLALLESAVANGRAQAATTLGRIHLAGEAVPKDDRKALHWFLTAGEMGDPAGMAKAGLLLGEAKDEASQKQGRMLIWAALSNNTQTAYSEIFPHVMDSVVRSLESRNPPLATNDPIRFRRINGTLAQGILESAGDDGLVLVVGTNRVAVPFTELDVAGRTRCDPAFRKLLSRSLVLERVFGLVSGFTAPASETSQQDMEAMLKRSADKGDPEAQAWLGSVLLEEPTTEREGLDWLKKSSDAGCPDGQHALGMAYLRGIGQPVDKTEGLRLFRLAADQGNTEALLAAGRMLMAGEGCERQENTGLDLLRQAANEMESRAVLLMGQHYLGDKRGMGDAAQAFAWFRLGAMLGTPGAQYWLGRMYYEGRGVPTDYNRAIQWLMQSASQGYRPAAKLLDSDEARKNEMAQARAAYQQELDRHSKELERIQENPKYDTVVFSRTPSFFGGPEEKAAYQRFTDNYFKGRFGYNIAKCADEAWRYVGSGSSLTTIRYIPQGSAEWRDSMSLMRSGATPGLSGGMKAMVEGSMNQFRSW